MWLNKNKRRDTHVWSRPSTSGVFLCSTVPVTTTTNNQIISLTTFRQDKKKMDPCWAINWLPVTTMSSHQWAQFKKKKKKEKKRSRKMSDHQSMANGRAHWKGSRNEWSGARKVARWYSTRRIQFVRLKLSTQTGVFYGCSSASNLLTISSNQSPHSSPL